MKLHLLCLVLILVVNTNKASDIFPIPELHFENKIIEDDDTTITCTLRYKDPMEVRLVITGNETLRDCEQKTERRSDKVIYTSIACTLTVTRDMDAMEFTCEAHFQSKSKPEKMFLWRDPEFTECPNKQVWTEEEENSFLCLADGYPRPNVTCHKDHGQYRAGEKITPLRNMSGNYNCKARNYDEISRTVQVIVEYKPKVLNLTVKPPLHNDGDNVTITCKADGDPAPTYTWKTPSVDVHFSPDNKTITVRNMRSSHLGKYMCIASNKHGSHSLELELGLAVQPVLSFTVQPSTEVLAGHNVTLFCNASGVPPPDLSWNYPNTSKVNISKDKHTIQIWKAKKEYMGNYSCTARNKHGTATETKEITLAVRPKVLSINVKPSTTVSENGNVTLTCVAEGVPHPTYSWHHPKENVLSSHDKSTINIVGAKKSHAGNYSCTAENKHGRDTLTKEITVKGNGDRTEMRIATILTVLLSSSLMFYLS